MTAAVGLIALVLSLLGLRSAEDPGDVQAPAAASSSTTSSSPSSSTPTPTPTTTRRTLPPYTVTGTFSRFPTKSGVRGTSGQLVTYRVEVEQGSGVTSRQFARVIDRTLRHPRGWTAGGQWRFQRIEEGRPDLVIRLAAPETVDERCAAAGADTDGYTSCRAGQLILLNLDRWYVAVPHVKDISAYRQYLINHEVGHGLGRGHEDCGGAGWRAPVMLQQTLDLEGCRPNPWPYTGAGEQVRGPATE